MWHKPFGVKRPQNMIKLAPRTFFDVRTFFGFKCRVRNRVNVSYDFPPFVYIFLSLSHSICAWGAFCCAIHSVRWRFFPFLFLCLCNCSLIFFSDENHQNKTKSIKHEIINVSNDRRTEADVLGEGIVRQLRLTTLSERLARVNMKDEEDVGSVAG
jgi:hypothetical protein